MRRFYRLTQAIALLDSAQGVESYINRKLKIALRRRSSEQGFAIPIAVGMGLVMILVGATMIVRSQGDEVTASAQKATAKGLGVAETGVTRV